MEFGWGFKDEILPLLRREPATDREQEAAGKISDVDYAIYSEQLHIICEEAKEVFVRSGRCRMLLAGDLVVGLYTALGDMVCAMAGAYIHAITGIPPIKYIIRRWKDDPTVGVNEGDFFFNSDPLFGSLHTVDQAVLMPIFSNGELIAWSCAAVHEGDVGCGPGPGHPPIAKSRFDEGLKVPPLKIGENYQPKQDVVHLLGSMTRAPEMHETDLRARAAACDRVRIRIQQLAKERGNDFILGLIHRMITETERGAKESIKKWNDGKYRCVIFQDMVGPGEKPCLIKLPLTAIKKDDHITLDFSECSPENETSWNSFAHVVVAHLIHQVYWGPWSTLPVSSGLFATHDFIFKPGTFYNASQWASTINGVCSGGNYIGIGQIIYSKMMYASDEDRPLVQARYGAGINVSFGGMNQWNVPMADLHTIHMNTSGTGARSNCDGGDTFIFGHCPWGRAPDIEEIEAENPWLEFFYTHMIDGGGYGKYRGGCGMSIAELQHHMPWCVFTGVAGHGNVPAMLGLFGGYPARSLPHIIVRNTDVFERMSKGDIVTPRNIRDLMAEKVIKGEYTVYPVGTLPFPLMEGEIYATAQCGGGGYGDVLEREPESVMKDLRDEIISNWTAQNIYKVAYDPNTLEVDYQKTEERRQLEREDRKKRGKKYQEFEEEWLAKRPPEEALYLYGSWPDAKPIRPVIRI